MATHDVAAMYAMYVVGEVESGWNWASVNYTDPITIGMMQYYGQRAAQLIGVCRDNDPTGYAAFASAAPQLVSDVDAGHDWGWWTNRYITAEEGSAWEAWAANDLNHQGQQELWIASFDIYLETATGLGMSLDQPKTLIFWIAMYHQSPLEAGHVIGQVSGMADLDTIYAACLNNPVLGNYYNRYSTVYNRLNAWDGVSMPPDFGQLSPGDATGNAPGTTRPSVGISYVELRNGEIVVWGVPGYDMGLYCFRAGANRWVPNESQGGAPNPGTTTGGGSSTDAQAVVDLLVSYMPDSFAYAQGAGRLDPLNSGTTDCSGIIWWCYQQVTGINVGTWTKEQEYMGQEVYRGNYLQVDIDTLRPADIVLVDSLGDYGQQAHACLYLGGNQLGEMNYGRGPTYVSTPADAYIASQPYCTIRRHL